MGCARLAAPAVLALTLYACGSQHAAAPTPAPRRAGAGGTARAPAPPPPAQRLPTGSQAGAFAILRRPARPGDRLPPRAQEAVRRGNDAHLTGGLTLRAGSARRVALPGFPAIWVLGGPGAICLLTAEPPAGAGAVEYALGCVPPEEAVLGRLVRTYTDLAFHPPRLLVEGILPDRAGRVALDLGGARHQPLPLRENAYAGLAQAPLSVSFHIGAAGHTVALPLAPGSPGALLGAAG